MQFCRVVFGGGPQCSSGGVWWRSSVQFGGVWWRFSVQFWWCLVEVLSAVLVVFGGGPQCSSVLGKAHPCALRSVFEKFSYGNL